jgi:fucose permease
MIVGVTDVLELPTAGRDRRVLLSKTALAGVAACFLLMGAVVGGYGPLLEHLSRRFEISLAVAGAIFSAHFAGALIAVFVSMWAMERVSGRISIWVALGSFGLGCAVVALAPAWPAFLAGVFVVGFGFGGLDLGLNQLVAHSEGRRRSAVLNGLNGAFGLGAVAGPILISRLGRDHFSLLYFGAAVFALALFPAVAGIRGRLPVTPRTSNYRPGALVGLFIIAFVFYVGLEIGVGGWMTSHLESLGRQSVEAASLTSGFWLAMAVGRLLAVLIPDRIPPPAVVISGTAIASIALLCALNSTAAPIAYIVTGLAIAPVFPTGLVWLTRLRPGDSRATSWMFPATMVGGGVIPAGIGIVIASVGLGWAPAVLSAVGICTIAAFVLAGLRGRE